MEKQALKFQAIGKSPSIGLNQFKSASIILREKYFHKIFPAAFHGEENCNLFHLHALQI
jgi:hypothetical protein